MGTRSIIARGTRDSWEGVYHHWDGYPTALGATLFKVFNGYFEQNAKALLRILLDEHRGGWSTINNADFSQPPGFDGPGPKCYCHGTRSEGPYDLLLSYGKDWAGAEYCYVINPKTSVMSVLERVYDNGTHAMSMFGLDSGAPGWKCLADVPLLGPEPD